MLGKRSLKDFIDLCCLSCKFAGSPEIFWEIQRYALNCIYVICDNGRKKYLIYNAVTFDELLTCCFSHSFVELSNDRNFTSCHCTDLQVLELISWSPEVDSLNKKFWHCNDRSWKLEWARKLEKFVYVLARPSFYDLPL